MFFKKKKEEPEMTTSKEIKKALDEIEEKGADEQTVEDRVDESVAAQEKDSGTEDTQDAKDRVDEAEGEDEAEEKDEKKDLADMIRAIVKEELEAHEAAKKGKTVKEAADEDKKSLSAIEALYN